VFATKEYISLRLPAGRLVKLRLYFTYGEIRIKIPS